MTKICLIAEEITDQLAFIWNLRKLTGKSISEIRENLIYKTPFFEGEVNGNCGEETEDLILELLRFSNEQGNKIRIVQLFADNPFEISQEIFENQVESRKETARYYEEFDELEEV